MTTPLAERTTMPKAAFWVATVVAVLGAFVFVAQTAQGVSAGLAEPRSSWSGTQDIDGVRGLDLSVAAGRVDVEFGNVEEASLDVTASDSSASAWTFEVESDTLVVAPPDRWNWIGSWWDGGESNAVLTLPASLEGIDADFSISAGSLRVAGELGEVGLNVSGGVVDFAGSASALTAEISAGEANVDANVDEFVDLDISAGSFGGTIEGAASAFTIDVSAGEVVLQVPSGPYAVTVDNATGAPSNIDVLEAPGADRTIEVDLSAGTVDITQLS